MSDTLGARLRTQREGRNIALSAIAEDTKINIALLKALELDDTSRWPTGIFRRSFVRSYARAIGLDGEAVLQEFLAAHPDPSASHERAGTVQDGGSLNESRGPLELGRLAPTRRTPEPERAIAVAPPSVDVDLVAAADVSTKLAQVHDVADLEPVLANMVTVVGARGMVLWQWRTDTAQLVAASAAGYAGDVIRKLPRVGRDSDNATAAAFRLAQMTVVSGGDSSNGAITVPAMSPCGVVGVLAIELPDGREHRRTVQAVATMWAAQLGGILAGVAADGQVAGFLRRA